MTNEYQDRANYYNNLHFLDETITAVVHLEDEEDCLFWKPILSQYGKGNYKYIYHTRENNVPGGCEECLKYKPYLSPYFFVCIDSDMRYILQEQDINVQHYICQTYTYSIENHFCEANTLQSRFAPLGQSFDFTTFLSKLSEVVYEPLLILTHNLRNNITSFGIREYRSCFPSQCCRADLANNGQPLLEKLHSNFERYNVNNVDLSAEVSLLQSLDITPDNAYLHVRGHNLCDLVLYIGNLYCQHIKGVSFKNDILYKSDFKPTYWELSKIISDIQELNRQN